MHAIRAASSIVLLLTCLSGPITAQQTRPWFVSIRAVPMSFGAAASTDEPASGDVPEFGPGQGLRAAVEAGRRFGRWELSLGGSYGKHGFRGSDGSATVTIEPGYTTAIATVTATYAVVHMGSGARLNLFAGPSMAFWSGEAVAEDRTLFGGRGGVGVIAPLTEALSLDAHAALGLSQGPIRDDDLADLESRYDSGTLWSREFGIGLRISF